MVKLFKLYWRNGSTNIIKGNSIEVALNSSSYGLGALKALDYYKEIKSLPKNDKKFEYKEKGGGFSEISNPSFIKQIRLQSPDIGDEVTIDFAMRKFKYRLIEETNYCYRFGEQVIVN